MPKVRRVTVTICFDTDANDDDISTIATDMLVQTETLVDDLGHKVLWADICEFKKEDLEELT